MKALGAGKLAVASVFFAEATLLALFGGLVGFACRGNVGSSDWPLHLQFGDYDFACAVASDPGDCSDRHICGKRRQPFAKRWGWIRCSLCEVNCEYPGVALGAGSCGQPGAVSHTSMFLRMLVRAAILRRGRALSALFAMVVAAAVATAMLNLYIDVQAKLRREFRN